MSRIECNFLVLFSFPRDLDMRNHWVRQIKLMNDVDDLKITPRSCVCDNHFESDDKFPVRTGSPQRLKKFAIPTICVRNEIVWKL